MWQTRGMTVTPHTAEDRGVLHERMTRESNAKQRDRYRAVLLAMDGLGGDEIAGRVGRSPRFVDGWAGRYRKGGVEALVPKKQSGRPPKLTPGQEAALEARLDAGPRRPPFARELNDRRPDQRVRWFVQDEARVGQQGALTRVWARTGSRPTAVRQTEYEWVYLWAAVEPATGASVAMTTPTVNTALMNTFLAGLSGTLAPDEHAVPVLDNAGRHVARALHVPDNITLLFLPAYAPELNPVERLWAWLRSHQLANRVYAGYDELLRETDRAWLGLSAQTLKSVCACHWIERAIQS